MHQRFRLGAGFAPELAFFVETCLKHGNRLSLIGENKIAAAGRTVVRVQIEFPPVSVVRMLRVFGIVQVTVSCKVRHQVGELAAVVIRLIRDCCPEAWVINYTNPMSLCVKTLYEAFPGVKAFGCCHEVFGTQELLAHAAADMLGVPVPPRQQIHTEVLGINHFTWFRAASWQGVDLFPLYRAFTEKYRETGFQEPGRNWLNSSFDCAHLVKFDLFRRYGWIAAAGDRHLAEFMPGDEYLADPETVARWKFGLTPVSWRKADLVQRLEKSARLVRGGELTELKPSGEEGVLLMKALLGLERVVSSQKAVSSFWI